MSDPFLVAALAVSAVGSVAQGQASARAANLQSAVLAQQAERERQIAERDAERFRRQQGAIAASAHVRRAGSGVLPNEGSSLLVEDAIFDEILLGEAFIKQGGQVRASRLLDQAALARLRGRAARTQGFFRAGRTLLTAGSNVDFGGGGFPAEARNTLIELA